MSAFAVDWLNLLVRWAHLVAGIAWIGTSFYFIALDLSLRQRNGMPSGVTGTAWEVHGGGFYHVQKYSVAPEALPPQLIWFKWEAYLTWLSGFALMVVQFYVNPGAWLIDPQVLDLAPWQAVGISVASLVIGWFVYDGLCRSPLGRNPALLAAAVFMLILASAWFFTHVFSGRGALIHVGAVVGTMMAANVFAVIIPNQKKVVASLLAKEAPDPRYGQVGKQRSVHNTYLTLPVLVLMVGGHYPMLTSHPQAWLLVGLIVVGGAAARHLLLRHEVGEPLAAVAWTFPLIAGALLGALWLTAPEPRYEADTASAVGDAQVLAITNKHCLGCHAALPASPVFTTPPKNVVLQTVDDIRRYGALIDQHTVRSQTMPLGNSTGMTDAERELLGRWLAAQR